MHESDHDFEAKLAALRPARPSAELPNRIMRTVAARRRRTVVRSIRYAAAAAIVLGVGAWLAVSVRLTPHQPMAGHRTQHAVLFLNDKSPTLAAYQRVWRQSPQALNRLLAQHARTLLPPTRELSLSQLLKENS